MSAFRKRGVLLKKYCMKSIKKIAFALIAIVVSAQFSLAAGIKFQDLTLEEGLKKAKKENKKVFIDVYATWCGPCKYLSKNIFVDDDLGAFMNENFVSLKLDGEKDDGLVLMNTFDLDSYPTMLFLDADMELIKKIVGVVDAEQIQAIGNEVIHPEETAIYQLEQKYKAGNRERAVLAEYAVELLNADRDFEGVVNEFLEKYPEPNLKDDNEFLMFCLGVTDRKGTVMKTFLGDLDGLAEIHGEFVMTKLNMILFSIVTDAIEAENPAMIASELDVFYPFYEGFVGEEAEVSKEQILEAMNEMYAEEVGE